MSDDFLFADETDPAPPGRAVAAAPPWPVLVVDDDPEMHAMTRLVMRKFTFQDRPLELLSAYSAEQALEILRQRSDIALVLLDVVMETQDAGLRLVARIRGELGNDAVRIVLRTGQPGDVPEEEIIHNYDINDYKAKTELTARKLGTSVVAALRSYAQITGLDRLRDGLERVAALGRGLDVRGGVDDLAATLLTQLADLLGVPGDGVLCGMPDGGGGTLVVLAAAGRFRPAAGGPLADIRADVGADIGGDAGAAAGDGDLAAAVAAARMAGASGLGGRWLVIPLVALPVTTPTGEAAGIPASALCLSLPRPLDGYGWRLADVAATRVMDAWQNLASMARLRATRWATAQLLAAGRPYPGAESSWTPDGGRGVRLSRLAVRLATLLRQDPAYATDLAGDMPERIAMGAMLYDIGMQAVPGNLPGKPGPLTPEEVQAVRRHCRRGADLMRTAAGRVGGDADIDFCAMLAQTHHEWWDGNGYPDGLRGDAIPLAARIIAVADTYDALTHPRINRPALSPDAACGELRAAAGRQLDPAIVAVFVRDQGVAAQAG